MKDIILRGSAIAGARQSDPSRADKAAAEFMANQKLKTTTKYLMDDKGLLEAIDGAKKHIAARNPVAATRLDGVRDVLWSMKHGIREVIDGADRAEYLAAVTLGFDAHEPELARLVLALAWMHGPLTWWRVKRAWKTRVRDNGGWMKGPPPKGDAAAPDA